MRELKESVVYSVRLDRNSASVGKTWFIPLCYSCASSGASDCTTRPCQVKHFSVYGSGCRRRGTGPVAHLRARQQVPPQPLLAEAGIVAEHDHGRVWIAEVAR